MCFSRTSREKKKNGITQCGGKLKKLDKIPMNTLLLSSLSFMTPEFFEAWTSLMINILHQAASNSLKEP